MLFLFKSNDGQEYHIDDSPDGLGRKTEAQRRNIGEGFFVFLFRPASFWLCFQFQTAGFFVFFVVYHLNYNQPFLQSYISAASKLNVGGMADSDGGKLETFR